MYTISHLSKVAPKQFLLDIMSARIRGKIAESYLIGILTMFPVHGEQNNAMNLCGQKQKYKRSLYFLYEVEKG